MRGNGTRVKYKYK